MAVTFVGANALVWLPGQQRPNQILANDQAVVQKWTIGPNRLPTAAQNPYLNPDLLFCAVL